jgi:2-hydroxy-3-keto-5-methylthiopentenyl-1-phosphate phosphatase
LRPGLDSLLAGVYRAGGAAWLASGGFDFYIRAILDDRMVRFERTYFNSARFADGRIDVSFPHAALACDRCAVCKGRVCDLARSAGARVIFAGDGASDRCAIGRADVLCAVQGSLLARACDDRRAPYIPFTDLSDILEAL